jgi:hypothetical protein
MVCSVDRVHDRASRARGSLAELPTASLDGGKQDLTMYAARADRVGGRSAYRSMLLRALTQVGGARQLSSALGHKEEYRDVSGGGRGRAEGIAESNDHRRDHGGGDS